jgi:hypothetical protein
MLTITHRGSIGKVKDYNLCAGPMCNHTNAADPEASAMTIAMMSEQELIIYLLHGIPKNDEWKVFLELMMGKYATMTTMPEEIVTKLAEKNAAIKRENGLTPEALLFAKKGGRGGRGGKVGKGARRDKRDNQGDIDKKDKNLRKCFHCQRQGHITKNCLSNQRGYCALAANTVANASTETTSTQTTSNKNYWMVAKSNASSSD